MLWNLLGNLAPLRVETTVVFYEAGPFEREVAGLPGIETEIVAVGRLRHLGRAFRAVRELAGLMRASEPDLVLNWAAKAQIYGACAARLAGIEDRVVWWQHAIPTGHWLERMATLLPARAIGCSSGPAAAAQARLRPRRDVFVVHPGIEPDRVEPTAAETLGIPAQRLVFGIVGRLQPWKGQHRFVRALSGLIAAGHDVHGLIVGGDAHGLSPEYPAHLERLITELQLTDRITMTGQVADARPYVAAMDVLVNASEAEPFGIVIIEGLSQGVPVIAVGDGGAREILENGVSGVLIPEPGEALLETAMRELAVDPAKRRRIGNAGRETFLERFTAQAMAAKLEAELERRCERGRTFAGPIAA